MTHRTAVTSADLPPPLGPYSHGVVANGFFYSAGIGPKNAAGEIVGTSIAEQTRQTMRNILGLLAVQGLDASHIVKSTVHLADLADFPAFNTAYAEFLIDPYPVRTTVQSVLPIILVEIDVVAVVPTEHRL